MSGKKGVNGKEWRGELRRETNLPPYISTLDYSGWEVHTDRQLYCSFHFCITVFYVYSRTRRPCIARVFGNPHYYCVYCVPHPSTVFLIQYEHLAKTVSSQDSTCRCHSTRVSSGVLVPYWLRVSRRSAVSSTNWSRIFFSFWKTEITGTGV